jgi:uncharacterized protein
MAILDNKDIPIEIHFISETVSVQDGEFTRDLEVSQLVRPGGLVVSIVQDDADESSSEKKKPHNIHLVAAENCEHSVGGQSILSTVTGYPHIDFKEDGEKHLVVVAVTPMVKIPEDRLKAAITLHTPVGDSAELKVEDLLLFLKEAGVVYGIDQRFLKKALDQANVERNPVIEMVVAHAMLPINGSDATLRMEVEIGSMPGKLRGDGSIDFRERRMFVSVEEGQLIATKIKASPGIPGKNVMGQLIPQKEGRDITVRVTEDAVFREEDLTVRALKAGVVSVVKDNTIRVSSKQSISGDIDFNTGNIYSKNSVEIGGSVKQDFVVSSRGDVMIGGDIQSAIVNSHGNLIVRGGIVGSSSSINIRGDADINFIENGTVHSGGNVVLRKSSYYSTIIADGNIAGDQKTKIVGGVVVCSGSMTAGEIGSKTAGAASITVGCDIKRYHHYQELHKQVIDLTEQTALWLQRHGPETQKSSKMIEMEQELVTAKSELASLNLIPGSPEHSMSEDFTVENDAEIIVYGEIYAGTKLRIGNVTKTIALNQNKKKFRIDKTTNTIVVVPL